MTSDERATAQLLGSWYDWIPGPKTSTGQIVARGALPGEAATSKRDCPSCAGHGRKRVRGIEQPCERCAGGGTLLVDGYTGRELPGKADLSLVESIKAELELEDEKSSPDSGTAGTARAARKAQQDALVSRLREGEPGDTVTAAWDARQRQYEAGDYAALESAMSRLRLSDKAAHDALLVVHTLEAIDPGLRRIGPRLRERAEQALPVLAATMRGLLGRPIRVPGWVRARAEREREALHRGRAPGHERARGQRNGVIVAMAVNGKTSEEIAERTGLTARRVRQVVASSSAAPLQSEATGTFAL